MTTGSPIADGFLGAFGAFAVTWTIAFVVRFMNAPVALYHEQKDRADKLEELRQIANDASRPPSFDIGYEYSAFDEDAHHGGLYSHHSILRIWVENLENRSIEDCRVVVENFSPTAIRKGALLLPDDRTDDEQSAQFHLAATEKKFFRFIEVESHSFAFSQEYKDKFELKIRCDQEGTGTYSFLNRPALEIGKQYFATIVVHGKNANSRRMALTIDALSETNLHVTEADSTASYRKEIA